MFQVWRELVSNTWPTLIFFFLGPSPSHCWSRSLTQKTLIKTCARLTDRILKNFFHRLRKSSNRVTLWVSVESNVNFLGKSISGLICCSYLYVKKLNCDKKLSFLKEGWIEAFFASCTSFQLVNSCFNNLWQIFLCIWWWL